MKEYAIQFTAIKNIVPVLKFFSHKGIRWGSSEDAMELSGYFNYRDIVYTDRYLVVADIDGPCLMLAGPRDEIVVTNCIKDVDFLKSNSEKSGIIVTNKEVII